jgi:hypothetical protein
VLVRSCRSLYGPKLQSDKPAEHLFASGRRRRPDIVVGEVI